MRINMMLYNLPSDDYINNITFLFQIEKNTVKMELYTSSVIDRKCNTN